MKRKVVSPDIQQKKRQQLLRKDLRKDLKHQLENERIAHQKNPLKNSSKQVRTGHK